MEKMIGQHLASFTKQANERLSTEQPVQEPSAPSIAPQPYTVIVLPNAGDPVIKGPSSYIVTSVRFTGKAELIYMDGVLQDVKMMETNMKPAQRHAFKTKVQVYECYINLFQHHTGVTMEKGTFEISFDQFWNDYHRTLGVPKEHKDRSLKEWSPIDASERVKAWLYIKEYYAFLQLPRNKGRGIKNADTYLKSKPWRNE